MNAVVNEDDKLLDTYCAFCGTMIGRLEMPVGKAGFHCPRCKRDFIVNMKDGVITYRPDKRARRNAPVMA